MVNEDPVINGVQDIHAAFKALDEDGEGVVGKDIVKKIFLRLGTWPEKDLDKLLNSVGKKGGQRADGNYNYEDFLRWVLGEPGRAAASTNSRAKPATLLPPARSQSAEPEEPFSPPCIVKKDTFHGLPQINIMKADTGLTCEAAAEVLKALQVAHAPRLRHTPAGLLPCLAEGAIIEEFSPGTILEGKQAWRDGTRVVMRGKALILMDVAGTDGVVIAKAEKGDSFGWHEGEHDHFINDDRGCDEGLWNGCRARIVVVGDQPLRVGRLTQDPTASEFNVTLKQLKSARGQPSPDRKNDIEDKEESQRLAKMAAANRIGHCEPDVHSRLGSLWLMAGPTDAGLHLLAGVVRSHFLTALWLPLFDLLEGLKVEMHSRQERGFRVYDRFPIQGTQINEMRDHIKHLTEVWYGTDLGGNYSVLYKWFMESMDVCSITAYSYNAIMKPERSPDGFAVLVDNAPRAAALKAKAAAAADALKGASQKQGHSAIDNTVLRNIFLPREAEELLVGKKLRKLFVNWLAMWQRIILRKLSDRLHLPLTTMACEMGGGSGGHRAVKLVLDSLREADVREAGVDPEGICFRMLKRQGSVITGYGQLKGADQINLQNTVTDLLGDGNPNASQATVASEDSSCVFERFVAWNRDHPGTFFENDKMRHTTVKLAGIWCDKIVIVKRSAMEKFTLARYFRLNWERCAPLWSVAQKGDEPFMVRQADIAEASNIRVNECPYSKCHGMALSAGGFDGGDSGRKKGEKQTQADKKRYSMLMECQWVKDPSANIKNWGLTDIEKIVNEAYLMNPHGPKESILPGEGFMYVGQNPKVGSSIAQTQHTQLCEANTKDYPMTEWSTNPRLSASLDATIDVVDTGPEDRPIDLRGTFLKVVTKKPNDPKVCKMLVKIRKKILEKFGGSDLIDFLVGTMSDQNGLFTIVFAPIAQLQKVDGVWKNPLTGELATDAGLDEPRIDFGKGVGHYLVERPALRVELQEHGAQAVIQRVYAFNRIPKLRQKIEDLLLELSAFE